MTTLQHDLTGAAIVCRNADYPKLASRCEQAAAEIIRLEAVNADLVAGLVIANDTTILQDLRHEIARIEAVNAELIATVTALLEALGDYWADQNLDAVNAVHAALARALPRPTEAE